MVMNRISICLKVPKYLKKVLEVKFGENYHAKENNWFGTLVLNVLTKKSDRYYTLQKNNATECFVFTISQMKAKYKGYGISELKLKSIVRSIDSNFREDLYYNAIRNQIYYGIDYKTTIEDILDSYDIEEDELSYETLRKDFNRNKHRILKNITEKSAKKI